MSLRDVEQEMEQVDASACSEEGEPLQEGDFVICPECGEKHSVQSLRLFYCEEELSNGVLFVSCMRNYPSYVPVGEQGRAFKRVQKADAVVRASTLTWHYIHYHKIPDTGEKLSLGATAALLLDDTGKVRAKGLSICSEKDTPTRRKGRDIARGRAAKLLELEIYKTMSGDNSGQWILKIEKLNNRLLIWRQEAITALDMVGISLLDWHHKAEINPTRFTPQEQKVIEKHTERMQKGEVK